MHLLIWNIQGLRTSLPRSRLLLHQHPVLFLVVVEPQQTLARLQRAKIQLGFSSCLSLRDDRMWCF